MRALPSLVRAAAGGAAVLLACAVAGGCGRSAASGKTIGVTLLTREDEFYQQLEEGLRQSAAAHGYTLVVTSGDRDLARQQAQIDNFIVQKVDAIIVCPVDSKGIGPAIERANAASIPVFTADISADGGQVISHIASDNVAGGRLAAEYIARAIGDKGDVGIVTETDVQSTIDREKGFREALVAHPGVKVVAAIDGAGRRDRSLKAADDMLQAHAGIRGIFAINDESALGVLSSVQSRHNDKVVIVGYDADNEAQKAIAGGTALKADVAQQPRVIGARTVDAIADHFLGLALSLRIAVPVRIVDADSVRAMAAPAKP